MKLTKSTKINLVIFRDNNLKNINVFSADMNTTFGQYLKQCKKTLYNSKGKAANIPNSINQMLQFNFYFSCSERSCGRTLNLYHYEDARFICSFIEIAA